MKKTLILGMLVLVLAGGFSMLAIPEASAQVPVIDLPSNAEDVQVRDATENSLKAITEILVIIAIAMIVIAIIWGAVAYMLAGGDPEKAKSARAIILNGVIGAIVLFAISFIIGFAFGFADQILKIN